MHPERTHEDRWRQAVVEAAAAMDTPENKGRLQSAIDLVLADSVSLSDDGIATVKSGSHTYEIAPECTCEESRRRSKYCKHFLSVALLKRASERFHRINGRQPEGQPSAWNCNQAPSSCTVKWHLNGIELMLTLRDTGDDLLFARLRKVLPKIQEKVSNGQGTHGEPAGQSCPLHNVPMKRYSKGKQVWYSHQTPDGQWCRGT